MKKLFALVDVNNFYVSSERIFNPKLKNKPVIVLSNNDGCAVARSQEAKNLGIKMGAPYFQIQKQFGEKVTALSSNYTLYAEISNRFHRLVGQYACGQEVYSIDESFLDFSYVPDPMHTASQIYARCKRDLGIPVCVGIGSTKTRTKLANHIAKKNPEYRGRVNIETMDPSKVDSYMKQYKVGEVWGIGRRLENTLNSMQIYTIYDLKNSNAHTMRAYFSVVMEKTILELQGNSCLELEEIHEPKQQIMTSRSFGNMVTEKSDLSEAITYFVTRGGEKLRKQGSRAGTLTVFIKSNKHRKDLEQYNKSYTVSFTIPTDDSFTLLKGAMHGLDHIYKSGINYKKAGILLGELESGNFEKLSLFGGGVNEKHAKLMGTLDNINNKYGTGSMQFASQGINNKWKMTCKNRSPQYLTKWSEVPVCK